MFLIYFFVSTHMTPHFQTGYTFIIFGMVQTFVVTADDPKRLTNAWK